MGNSRLERETNLYRTALQQGGLFRYDQAASHGFSRRAASYRVQQGEWERISRGIYRLAFAPHSPDEDLIQTALWAYNRWGPVAFSHETALRLHELSDLLPDRHHLTVPERFDRKPPAGLTLHRANLSVGDLERRSGYYVTTPLRTLLDVARSPRISPEHLEAAVSQAIARGLVNKKGIDSSLPELSNAARKRLNRALAAAERDLAGSR